MNTLGLPTSMFLVFVATVLAGSLGAIHYVIVHVVLGKPFAEIPPPVVRHDPGLVSHPPDTTGSSRPPPDTTGSGRPPPPADGPPESPRG